MRCTRTAALRSCLSRALYYRGDLLFWVRSCRESLLDTLLAIEGRFPTGVIWINFAGRQITSGWIWEAWFAVC